MQSLLQAAARLQRQLDEQGWRFCFIGGIANFHWGTPRLTVDLDLTLMTGFGNEASTVDGVLGLFAPRIEGARDFALEHRVLLVRTLDGFPVDIALGAMPFEEASVSRALNVEIVPGALIRICSASDLVVHKAFAARPQDWVDVEGVIVKQRGQLEWGQIWRNLRELAELKGEPEILTELERVARRAERVIGNFSRGQ